MFTKYFVYCQTCQEWNVFRSYDGALRAASAHRFKVHHPTEIYIRLKAFKVRRRSAKR